MSSGYSVIDTPAVDTAYRRNVRRLIPIALQDLVRAQCGDQAPKEPAFFPTLPARCPSQLPTKEAAAAANKLREHPEVLDDLQWHMAAPSALIGNFSPFEAATRRVRSRLSRS